MTDDWGRFKGADRGWVKAPDQKDPPKERSALTEMWVERDNGWTVLHLHFHLVKPAPDQPRK